MSFQSGNLALHFEEMIFVASRDEYDALLITQRYLLLNRIFSTNFKRLHNRNVRCIVKILGFILLYRIIRERAGILNERICFNKLE